ncbi:MAG: hypothetical protein JJU46_00345 [Balneolaceae bacterium]|nr:hypothetical protein [Balneolaceae bacterium]MCH8550096.1 hypothetical protein [Balneolaceae bacterium]
MSAWIWVLIPLVAIVGGYIIDYQKNKLKWQSQTSSNEQELEELRLHLQQMRKRIENLEAIAAGDPEGFERSHSKIEVDPEESIRTENMNEVARKAKQKGE